MTTETIHTPRDAFEATLCRREIERLLVNSNLEVSLLDEPDDAGRWTWVAYRAEPFDLMTYFDRPSVRGLAWLDDDARVSWSMPVQPRVEFEQSNTADYFAPIVFWRDCEACGKPIQGVGKQRHCNNTCRQRAKRQRDRE